MIRFHVLAGAHEDPHPVRRIGGKHQIRQLAAQLLQKREAQIGGHGAGDDEGELVTAGSGSEDPLARGGLDPRRKPFEQGVPHFVTQTVIDLPEMPQIHEADGDAAAPPGVAGPLLEVLDERRPVRETGERVVPRQKMLATHFAKQHHQHHHGRQHQKSQDEEVLGSRLVEQLTLGDGRRPGKVFHHHVPHPAHLVIECGREHLECGGIRLPLHHILLIVFEESEDLADRLVRTESGPDRLCLLPVQEDIEPVPGNVKAFVHLLPADGTGTIELQALLEGVDLQLELGQCPGGELGVARHLIERAVIVPDRPEGHPQKGGHHQDQAQELAAQHLICSPAPSAATPSGCDRSPC